jgi:hypothetical protein
VIKKLIQNIFWKFDYDISRMGVPDENITNLINKMHPFQFNNSQLIRVGNSNGDGGYLVPDIMKNIDYSFTLGVGNDTSFEMDLALSGTKCFMADYSVNGPTSNHENFFFIKKFIKGYNSQNNIRFDEWKNNCIGEDYDSKILIKIDIEGDEYSVIPTINSKTLSQTEIIIVEFHHLTRLLRKDYQRFILATFERILEYFNPVHLHVNNSSNVLNKNNIMIPHLLEATFVNKRLINNLDLKYQKNFPNNLDKPNVSSKADIPLPKNWYRN